MGEHGLEKNTRRQSAGIPAADENAVWNPGDELMRNLSGGSVGASKIFAIALADAGARRGRKERASERQRTDPRV